MELLIFLKLIHFLNAVLLKTLNYFLKDTFEDHGVCLIFFFFFLIPFLSSDTEEDLNLLCKELKPLCMQVWVEPHNQKVVGNDE